MSEDTFEELMELWQLRPDGQEMGTRARVLGVRTHDNRRAVLKVAEPTGWQAGAIAVLKAWRGRDSVELLRASPARGAVLLERLRPVALGEELLPLAARLAQELHRPAHPSVPSLDEVLGARLDEMAAAGRALPLPPRLARQAITTGRRLLAEQGTPVLLHGALVPEHLMERSGELVAIAPLGLCGDAHAEAFAMLRGSLDEGAGSGEVQDRFWELVDALTAAGMTVDEQRLRDWALVGAVVAAAGLRPEQRRASTELLTLAKHVGAIQLDEGW